MCCCVEFGNTSVTVPPSRQATIVISDVTHAVSVTTVRGSPLVCLVWRKSFCFILASENKLLELKIHAFFECPACVFSDSRMYCDISLLLAASALS